MKVIIFVVAALAILVLIVTHWKVTVTLAAIALLLYFLPGMIRSFRKHRYFTGEEFLTHKHRLAAIVSEHNEVASYAAEIHNNGSFQLGQSLIGNQSHLASFTNTSHHNYRRDRNVANYASPNVHNCSLQVVRNASSDPLRYLMKYFGIRPDEDRLAEVEELGANIARLEGAIANLNEREISITSSFNPPAFIRKYYLEEFMAQVGVKLTPIEVPYPVYIFEYVSAGGNSSQQTTITLDTQTIDAFVMMLDQRIRFRQSVAGQRALMTARLRELIKARDNYACRRCSVSVWTEPHLLLEVDHVIPVSRGGLSTVDNLQTLCWKCNRSKSNKMPTT